jgi:hypothetical protein
MRLTRHPEYEKYLDDQELVTAVLAILDPWLAAQGEAEQVWETAVFRLSAMFQEYNRVMWQVFPFCSSCLGGCCVAGASVVTPLDAAALGVLGFDLPMLPAQTHHDDHACIYLGARGCTWPAAWRPFKCMAFFSLGRTGWQLVSADADYSQLTEALQAVLDRHLPAILGEEAAALTRQLTDPIQFAAVLSMLLAQRFLPGDWDGENGRSPIIPLTAAATALNFIAEIMEQILLDPPDMADQLMMDLEQFEWVVTGHPALEREILAEINSHYATHTQEHPVYRQFCQHIQQYSNAAHH